MKVKIEFLTDSEEHDYLEDIDQIKAMLEISKYKYALWNVQQRLRQIMKHSENIEKDFEHFYTYELDEIFYGLDIDS